jgi:hypothetical protein
MQYKTMDLAAESLEFGPFFEDFAARGVVKFAAVSVLFPSCQGASVSGALAE